MFCPKCGTNFADDGKFCPNCGFQVPKNAVNNAENAVSDNNKPLKKDKKKSNGSKKAIITLSIIGGVLIVALVAFLVFFFVINQKAEAKIDLQISGYSTSNSTRIPVNVVGKNVDQTMFIDENGEGLQLKNGEYEISFPASPLNMDGKFWTAPSATFDMNLNNGEFEYTGNDKIEFKEADMTTVTDSQIEAAATCARVDEENTIDIDNCVSKTKEAREKAIKEAEERRKAEEAALRAELAKSQIVSGTYLSQDGVYTMTVDVENLRYEIKIGGVTVVDRGRLLDKTEGTKYYHDEAISMEGEYGKQCFIVAHDKEYSSVSIAWRYLSFRDGKVTLDRKHDGGGAKPWETSYTFKW